MIVKGAGVVLMLQDQLYHDIIDASRSNRSMLIGPQAAQQFFSRMELQPKAKL